ncbi:hypothetical protein CJ177_43260 [Rhodococcus sp. ACPA1]|nr:hypothetical protein CJ177_43260 [Rhodococcus sp. ACPA1]
MQPQRVSVKDPGGRGALEVLPWLSGESGDLECGQAAGAAFSWFSGDTSVISGGIGQHHVKTDRRIRGAIRDARADETARATRGRIGDIVAEYCAAW